jgi:hypothetical protein
VLCSCADFVCYVRGWLGCCSSWVRGYARIHELHVGGAASSGAEEASHFTSYLNFGLSGFLEHCITFHAHTIAVSIRLLSVTFRGVNTPWLHIARLTGFKRCVKPAMALCFTKLRDSSSTLTRRL